MVSKRRHVLTVDFPTPVGPMMLTVCRISTTTFLIMAKTYRTVASAFGSTSTGLVVASLDVWDILAIESNLLRNASRECNLWWCRRRRCRYREHKELNSEVKALHPRAQLRSGVLAIAWSKMK